MTRSTDRLHLIAQMAAGAGIERERDHDACAAAALGGDALGRCARIGARDDRPADDEIARAGGERLGGAQRPATDRRCCVAGAANARRHDGERRAAAAADDRDLLRRRDDAVEPGRFA